MMATKSMKACRVAQDEISEGRVTFVVNHAPKAVVAVAPAEPDDRTRSSRNDAERSRTTVARMG